MKLDRHHEPPPPDDIQRLFNEHGLRCTRQRLNLYQALSATTSHPTADELYQHMAGENDGMSLATVYNTLEAFCSVGLAQKLPGKGTSARYDAAVHNHLHLRDRETGRVVDVPADLSNQLIQQMPRHVLQEISRRLGVRIDQIQIELVGQFERQTAQV